MLLTPLTELFKRKTFLELLLVLFTVVADALAFGTLKFDEIILRHMISLRGDCNRSPILCLGLCKRKAGYPKASRFSNKITLLTSQLELL